MGSKAASSTEKRLYEMREFTASAIIHLLILFAQKEVCVLILTCLIRSTTLSFIFITFALEARIHHPEQ